MGSDVVTQLIVLQSLSYIEPPMTSLEGDGNMDSALDVSIRRAVAHLRQVIQRVYQVSKIIPSILTFVDQSLVASP